MFEGVECIAAERISDYVNENMMIEITIKKKNQFKLTVHMIKICNSKQKIFLILCHGSTYFYRNMQVIMDHCKVMICELTAACQHVATLH